MDLKCIQLIHDIHNKILNQSFDEIDICTLLILIRDETVINRDYKMIEWEQGFLYEICSFIAHRNRNKGFVFEEAQCTYKHCTNTGVFHTGVYPKREILSGMFEDVIIKELNAIFEKMSLPPIPQNCECEIILCIMSLLQFSRVTSNDGRIRGCLYINLLDDGLYLHDNVMETGFGASVLCVTDNRYHNLVSHPIRFIHEPLQLKRVGTDLKIILTQDI